MPNSQLILNGRGGFIGSETYKAKLKINNVDWGTSTVSNTT